MAIGLTEKQRRFADAYTSEAQFNAAKAARIAGYSGNDSVMEVTGSKMLRHPKVRDYLDKKARAAARETSVITPERLIELLAGFAEDTELAVGFRLRAIEDLCKVFGMNLQKIQVDADISVEKTKVEIRNYLSNASLADSIKKFESDFLDASDLLLSPPIDDR